MITLYEFKHSKCTKCFFRTPYYIKNLFLLAVLAMMLFVIDVIYFRKDGMVI